jgi:uncharacterized protein (DUF885 family)
MTIEQQTGQFHAALPHYQNMSEVARYMNEYADWMHFNGVAMVQDMRKIVERLREEEIALKREHEVRLARVHGQIEAVEAMIAHHTGVLPPERAEKPASNVVVMPPAKKARLGFKLWP